MPNAKNTKKVTSACGRFLEHMFQRAFPNETKGQIATDHLNIPASTLSKWFTGRQRVSAGKGYRLAIVRVLNAAGVLDSDANSEFWSAYDFLWAEDHDDPRQETPPGLALPFSSAAQNVRSHTPSQSLPINIPGIGVCSHHFSARTLPMLGRGAELELLEAFLEEEQEEGVCFKWMQIAGVGGQGKSRLALELALIAKNRGWDAGFIHPTDFPDFVQDLSRWLPSAPTLLVIDYIIGFETQLGDVLNQLAQKTALQHSVRFLIVERQRWDRGFNLSGETEDGLSSQPGTGIADWFAKVTRSYQGRAARLEASLFRTPIVELKALDASQLVEIVRSWTEVLGVGAGVPHGMIVETLSRIDPSGRPLYAYFLAEALAADYDISGWTREDLLDATLTRDQQHRWAQSFGGKPPAIGDPHQAVDLAVLATLTGGLNVEEIGPRDDWPHMSAQTKKQALVLVDDPIGVSAAGPRGYIGRLEPDILGGWFILEWMRQAADRMEWMVNIAWLLKPKSTAAAVLRLAQDFPDHQALTRLLHIEPPSRDAERSFTDISSSLLVALRTRIDKFGLSIIPRIEAAALEGDLKAISRLGYCYQEGLGAEVPDLQKAFYWFEEGAKLGDGRCMAYLGYWYLLGRDGPPDSQKALGWFEKGAIAGDGHAMGYVGMCNYNGIGTAVDYETAVRWLQRGGEAGDGASLVYLGLCYLRGTGVKRNDTEAFDCFRKADELGSSHALAYLGQMYLEGKGVEKNEDLAVRYLKDGAATGSAIANAFLGYCHREGIGVSQVNVPKAVELFKKGVAGQSGSAMFFLGECHFDGIGVEVDKEQAVSLWQEADRLGDVAARKRLADLGLLAKIQT